MLSFLPTSSHNVWKWKSSPSHPVCVDMNACTWIHWSVCTRAHTHVRTHTLKCILPTCSWLFVFLFKACSVSSKCCLVECTCTLSNLYFPLLCLILPLKHISFPPQIEVLWAKLKFLSVLYLQKERSNKSIGYRRYKHSSVTPTAESP